MDDKPQFIGMIWEMLGIRRARYCIGCNKLPAKASPAIMGPKASLCRKCWDEAFLAMKGHSKEVVNVRGGTSKHMRCSMCGEKAASKSGLATWPQGAVCGDCLLLADQLFAEIP